MEQNKYSDVDGARFDGDYIGLANPGTLESEPFWKIIKASNDGVFYPNGSDNYIHVWDSRNTYNYL